MTKYQVKFNKIRRLDEFFGNQIRKRFVTVNEVALLLSVAPKTVRGWVYHNTIPHIRANGALRFDLVEIERWLGKESHVDSENKIQE